MASLTSSGLNLESGTTTLRSIIGDNVLVTSEIKPSLNLGTLKRDYDFSLPSLNPGQAAYCTVTNSSGASKIQVSLPGGGKFLFEVGVDPKPTISPNSTIIPAGTTIRSLTPGGSLYISYCRAY